MLLILKCMSLTFKYKKNNLNCVSVKKSMAVQFIKALCKQPHPSSKLFLKPATVPICMHHTPKQPALSSTLSLHYRLSTSV